MPSYKIFVEYDGADFSGWQFQPDRRTVQGELENALSRINSNVPVRIHGAGRTDSGVHARGQVASFFLNRVWNESKLCSAINGNCGKDVSIQECNIVPDRFHARYSAVRRMYRYSCHLGKSPISRRFAWEIIQAVSFEKLNICAELLIGDIDFTSFCKHISKQNNHRCIVNQSQWINSGSFVIFEIEANRFLQYLVRCLVGTMIKVAIGEMSVGMFTKTLDEKNFEAKVYRAPARGLCLEKVSYE